MFVFQPKGIVLCQLVVSASFAIRSVKTAFDEVDRRLEKVALTLGYTQWGSFLHVSLPLAIRGVMAGAILTWARAFGIFGPLMIFVGSFRGKTEVLSTTIFLEQSVGNLEVALAAALLLIAVAVVALLTIRLVGGKAPGEIMIRSESLCFCVGSFRLQEATLEVAQGEYFVLLGPPGSGKSIWLECLCGLNRLDSGRVLIRWPGRYQLGAATA